MEYPLLCSVTAGMLIKKGGFVMCKRKIKTIEAIFFLFLFSVIVLLLPGCPRQSPGRDQRNHFHYP